MHQNDAENETVNELINESGSIGEEQLPQVDVGKNDKAPWSLLADKMKRKDDSSKNGQEKYQFGGGL